MKRKLIGAGALVLILVVTLYGWRYQKLTAQQSCPVKENTTLKNIDLFDGDPKENAYLMLDEEGTNKGSLDVSYVYEANRHITLRCKYSDASIEDLRILQPVRECSYVMDKSGKLSASCK